MKKNQKSNGISLAAVLSAGALLGSLLLLAVFAVNVALAQKDFYVYPSKGQSQEQQETDRYECQEWAVKETGFDPMKPPEIEPKPDFKGGPIKKKKAEEAWEKEQQEKKATYQGQRKEFDRALKACITGRGYTVN